MIRTIDSSDYIGRDAVGYVVNCGLGTETQQYIKAIQDKLASSLGGKVWFPEPGQLHITLMDWLAPLVDYDEDKDMLFSRIQPEYDRALRQVMSNIDPIKVACNEIAVSPSAVFCKGVDGGQFESIRSGFLGKITLLPGTKQPPNIIHFSIARFIGEFDLYEVEEIVAGISIDVNEEIDCFRLVRESRLPLQEFKTIAEYKISEVES